jgi:hypothetical protein
VSQPARVAGEFFGGVMSDVPEQPDVLNSIDDLETAILLRAILDELRLLHEEVKGIREFVGLDDGAE